MRSTLVFLVSFLAPLLSHAESRPIVALKYSVVAAYPHDIRDFTQGLFLEGNHVLKSTGGYGRSTLIESDLKTGKRLQQLALDPKYFGEGLTVIGGRILQLTWQSNLGFIYNRRFQRIGEFRYRGEGWGLTHDGRRLILSDGTSSLRFLDPETFSESGSVRVHEAGAPLTQINELEYARGLVWANLWHQSRIVAIDADSGEVRATLDLSGLLKRFKKPKGWDAQEDVLNGIAYNPATDRFFVTGKRWPNLFELRVATLP